MSKKLDVVDDIVIIGAGFAGAFTAKQIITETTRNVRLMDSLDKVLPDGGTSANQCFKLHTGMHYAGHLETAIQCLRDSIEFARELPDCILGAEDNSLPWRRGRHYVMSNSLFNAEEVEKIAEALKAEYASSIQKDERNRVFGDPEDFIRELNRDEYSYIPDAISQFDTPKEGQALARDTSTSSAHITLAIETPESQIDLNKLRVHLQTELRASEKFIFFPHHEVKHIRFEPDSLNYLLEVYDSISRQMKLIRTKAIINCSWQNIEKLDQDLGYSVPDDGMIGTHRVIRIKASLLIELPKDLRNINTCIFSVGPHCSITNLGNGTAIATYEPVTNVGSYEPGPNPEFSNPLLHEVIGKQLTPKEGAGAQLAAGIMTGVACYVPGLREATVLEVHVGYVKMFTNQGENYSLSEKESSIHQRIENGLEEVGLAYLRNAAMKMTYSLNNAKRIVEAIEKQLFLREKLERAIADVRDVLDKPAYSSLNKVIKDTALFHSFREFILSNIKHGLDHPKPSEEDIAPKKGKQPHLSKEDIATEIGNQMCTKQALLVSLVKTCQTRNKQKHNKKRVVNSLSILFKKRNGMQVGGSPLSRSGYPIV